MDELKTLAELIKKRNGIGIRISKIINYTSLPGHMGEIIASKIFDLELHETAQHQGSDGIFKSGPLAGKNVNIKWYAKMETSLDINPTYPAEYYLVLAGPKSSMTSSRGTSRPLVINSVFLFESESLISQLKKRTVKIGIATSVTQKQWSDAEIFPNQRNNLLPVTEKQKELLGYFQQAT